MQYVTISSKRQITIPKRYLEELGFGGKAILDKEKGKLVIEPVKDILELGGSLKKYAIKGKNIDEIIKLEKKAVEEAVIERYKKKLKREGKKLLVIKP